MGVLLNRDKLAECYISAILYRKGFDPEKLHRRLRAGFKKTQKEWIDMLQNHAGESGLEILKDFKKRYKSDK